MANSIAISSGHGLYVRGASGSPIPPQLDEVDTARWVVDRVAQYLRLAGLNAVWVIHDNQSQNQSANLDYIVREHNKTERQYDISVHMNCYDGNAHGCEVLYKSDAGKELAQELVDAICAVGGFTNRGPKYRSDLAFLNGTEEVACLIELAFCDHTGDCQKVTERGDAICRAIAEELSGRTIGDRPPVEPPERPEDLPPKPDYLFYARGTMSTFGGPDDQGVSSNEGLAFFYEPEECPHLMLPEQPSGTSGMARRLDTNVFYVACRWDYDTTPKDMLRNQSLKAGVRNPRTGKVFAAFPADWGPHEQETGRAADLSPALAEALELETDGEVEVAYPIGID